MAVTNTVILLLDLAMLFTSAALYSRGQVDFTGVLIPTVALMSSFGPCVALANLGSTLQSTLWRKITARARGSVAEKEYGSVLV